MRRRASRSRPRITETASTTSSNPPARSKRILASTATSCGRFGLAAIVKFQEFISEFCALIVRQLVALGARARSEHRAGGCFFNLRFLAFHAVTVSGAGEISKPEVVEVWRP